MESKTIYFRLAEVTDAKFIHLLRMNEKYNKYLSLVDNNISKQEKWLSDYKLREKSGHEYYYIIHRKIDDIPIGTVRIYDFKDNKESFCWGSWILNENKTKYSALECVLLIYDFAFLDLGYKRCHMNIRKQNSKVIEFHKRLGVSIIGETTLDYLGHYFPDDYLAVREKLQEIIEQNS